MRADSSPSQLEDANQLLKRAAELCAELGDAWYYRSLVERRFGHATQADFAARQAQRFPSDASTEQANPFVLAAPRSRTVTGAGPVTNPETPSGPPAQWALVIGIGSFVDKNIEPLRYTSSDAQSFRDALLDHDTEIGASIDPDTLYATALPMVDIANAIATRVKARRAAIFLDTCYSGNAATQDVRLIAPGIKNSSPSAETLNHITQGEGRMVFAAAGTEQESLESDTLKHGFFTYYLVQALRQQGGATPLSRIFDYTQQHVSQTVAKEFNMQQNPVMGRSEESTDFALGRSALASAAGGE
jgi:hypothetical protein